MGIFKIKKENKENKKLKLVHKISIGLIYYFVAINLIRIGFKNNDIVIILDGLIIAVGYKAYTNLKSSYELYKKNSSELWQAYVNFCKKNHNEIVETQKELIEKNLEEITRLNKIIEFKNREIERLRKNIERLRKNNE